MANNTNEENWAARERLRVLEMLLWWRGWVGRADLHDYFGISAAQASSDFQKYLKLNGKQIFYQTSRKRYEATPNFTCQLHEPSLQEAVRVLLGGEMSQETNAIRMMPVSGTAGQVAILSLPQRQADPAITRRVFVALLANQRLRVFYHSLSSEVPAWRKLWPSALAWDGRRWHMRAWCENRLAWRDFVLGRISKAEWPEPVEGNLPEDKDWNEWETVRFKINPELDVDSITSLKMDYGLMENVMEVPVRRAMKGYLLAEMLINGEGYGRLPNHFVMAEE